MGDQLKQYLREPVGRTAESFGGAVDLANLGLGSLYATQQGRPQLTGLVPQPTGGSEWMRQKFGIPPAEQLPTAGQRASAVGYQMLGPAIAMGGAGRLATGLAGLGERGAVGPVGKAAEEAGPLWRDNILDALAEWPQAKGTPGQLKAHLAHYRGTKDQAEWIGLDEFLKDKPNVTREGVEQYVRENTLGVQEKVLGGGKKLAVESDPHGGWWVRDEHGRINQNAYGSEEAAREGAAYWGSRMEPTKFEQYQTPGGTNYREIVLTMPGFDPLSPEYQGAAVEEIRKIHGQSFMEGHFGIPNELAHMRINERTDVTGKPMVFSEEFQSDWHRQGREKGYQIEPEVKWDDSTPAGQRRPWQVGDERFASRVAADQRAREIAASKGVPDAPFKKTWPLLLVKRLIRYAADNNIDQIGWTTGEMQKDRYNLALKGITAAQRLGNGEVVANVSGEWQTLNKQQEEELLKLLGPRASELQSGKAEIDLAKEPLTIGGQWATNLYDKHIPEQVNKFVKKWGAKAGMTKLPTGETVWKLEITPELKKAAKRGMELSQAASGTMVG